MMRLHAQSYRTSYGRIPVVRRFVYAMYQRWPFSSSAGERAVASGAVCFERPVARSSRCTQLWKFDFHRGNSARPSITQYQQYDADDCECAQCGYHENRLLLRRRTTSLRRNATPVSVRLVLSALSSSHWLKLRYESASYGGVSNSRPRLRAALHSESLKLPQVSPTRNRPTIPA